MKIHEYQAEDLFNEYGIPIVQGVICNSVKEVLDAFLSFGNIPVALKAQVHTGGRGKAGGVKIAINEADVKEKAQQIFNLKIKNIPVKHILVVPGVKILSESYLSMTIDRNTRSVVVITCQDGGVDIEDLAKTDPGKIHKFTIDPVLGIPLFQAREFASSLFDDEYLIKQASSIIRRMYLLMIDKDASLIEINPLAVNQNNRLLALDAKMTFDDNALYRHADILEFEEPDDDEKIEKAAKEKGFSYVQLKGNIGCMVNGAGLAMATMDLIRLYGGEPANFLDIGGSSNPQKVIDAMKLLANDKQVNTILINIFGGITRCDDVAKGIIEAFKMINIKIPVIIRLAGTNAAEGKEILAKTSFISEESMDEAIKKAVEISNKK
ncbi:MAG: ADP-forming succinate--CoA ligase subunit beta [Bacteroidales bacterium]